MTGDGGHRALAALTRRVGWRLGSLVPGTSPSQTELCERRRPQIDLPRHMRTDSGTGQPGGCGAARGAAVPSSPRPSPRMQTGRRLFVSAPTGSVRELTCADGGRACQAMTSTRSARARRLAGQMSSGWRRRPSRRCPVAPGRARSYEVHSAALPGHVRRLHTRVAVRRQVAEHRCTSPGGEAAAGGGRTDGRRTPCARSL